MTPDDRWITVPNWGRFQHYGQGRRPIWIKNYNALLHKDEYIDMPLGLRGLLHGLWLAYAEAEGRIRRRDLASTLHVRAREAHLDSLQQAGFIELSASRPSLLDLNPVDTHAPEERRDHARGRRAANWIRNGAAAQIPVNQLADVIADEFHITDQELVADLVAQAQEHQK